MKGSGWMGVWLDGTLAVHEGWAGPREIGVPVPAMVQRVKNWLAEGFEVRIVTPRVGKQKDANDAVRAREAIEAWCLEHLGQVLPVTCQVDFALRQLWTSRAVQVIPNAGIPVEDYGLKAAAIIKLMQEGKAGTPEWERAVEQFANLVERAMEVSAADTEAPEEGESPE